MRTAVLLSVLLGAGMTNAQLVNGDFENGLNYDATGILSFCDALIIQQWTNTHTPTSLYAAAIPNSAYFGCGSDQTNIIPGFAMRLPGILPDHAYQLHLWLASTTLNYSHSILAIGYSPAGTGSLPASNAKMASVYADELFPTETWSQLNTAFNAPAWMPDTADVFLFISFFMPEGGALPTDLFLLDDLEMTGEFSTGAADLQAPIQLRAYPNPATDKLWVDLPEAPTSITAIDATGRTFQLRTFHHTGRTLEVEVSSVPPGLCVMLMKTNSGTRTLRFIKT